jgi:mannose-6-phosphate isomerase-like protein (cupin superfamily)
MIALSRPSALRRVQFEFQARDGTWPRLRDSVADDAYVNDALVRLGVFCGEYHWHKHDDQDEFFLVIDGELYLDVEEREGVVLQKHQGYTVPKGVVHRTRAPKRCVCVMIEQAGIVPTGD